MNDTGEDLHAWLLQEATDHIDDIGPLGLYELVWLLRGHEESLDDRTRIKLAQQVASELVEAGQAGVQVFRWPNDSPVATIDLASVPRQQWLEVPDSGEYAALVAVDSV